MSTVPEYRICPGHRIEVVVETPDGGRALVAGVLDSVPECITGGRALQLVVAASHVTPLPATVHPANRPA